MKGCLVRHRLCMIFLLGTALYALAMLPPLLMRGGFFYYYGDYRMQTLIMSRFAVEAIQEGYLLWNPLLDWGSSMAGSLGFYVWSSPFFWLLVPFPSEWVAYLLPVTMALRFGTATLCAYLWIRGFVRHERAAVIGALLYSFSGFSTVDIVFCLFMDVVAFWPLYLLSFDRLMQRKGRLGFILMTAFSVSLSYYFFYGQLIFLVMYFFVRYWRRCPRAKASKTSDTTARGPRLRLSCFVGKRKGCELAPRERARRELNRARFVNALACGILGVALAAPVWVQTVGGVSGNSRLADIRIGNAFLSFDSGVTIWSMIKSAFFVPELMGFQSYLASSEIPWASLSLYMPCVSLAGVLAYFHLRRPCERWRRDWKIRLVFVFLALLCIPGLGAIFNAFNDIVYFRWLYMAILILALMSACAFDQGQEQSLRAGARPVIAITAFFLIFSVLPGQSLPIFGNLLSLPGNTELYAIHALSTLIALLFFVYLEFGARHYQQGMKYLNCEALAVISVMAAVTTSAVLISGTVVYDNDTAQTFKNQVLESVPELDMSDFARVELDQTSPNYTMAWNMPSTTSFNSTPSPGSYAVFDNIGLGRTQYSIIGFSEPGFRQLLSTRYYLENQTPPEAALASVDISELASELGPVEEPTSSVSLDESEASDLVGELSASTSETTSTTRSVRTETSESATSEANLSVPEWYVYAGETDGFAVWETQHFIPMGFCFESYISEGDFSALHDALNLNSFLISDHLLVKDLILSDEQIKKYGDLLVEDSDDHTEPLSFAEFSAECDARAASACTSFSYNTDGYIAEITLDRENLVFFSIPYDAGWTVSVDGIPVAYEKVDYGFMAVDVGAGTHTIEFSWRPVGLRVACICSLAALIATVYVCYHRKSEKDPRKRSVSKCIDAPL